MLEPVRVARVLLFRVELAPVRDHDAPRRRRPSCDAHVPSLTSRIRITSGNFSSGSRRERLAAAWRGRAGTARSAARSAPCSRRPSATGRAGTPRRRIAWRRRRRAVAGRASAPALPFHFRLRPRRRRRGAAARRCRRAPPRWSSQRRRRRGVDELDVRGLEPRLACDGAHASSDFAAPPSLARGAASPPAAGAPRRPRRLRSAPRSAAPRLRLLHVRRLRAPRRPPRRPRQYESRGALLGAALRRAADILRLRLDTRSWADASSHHSACPPARSRDVPEDARPR